MSLFSFFSTILVSFGLYCRYTAKGIVYFSLDAKDAVLQGPSHQD